MSNTYKAGRAGMMVLALAATAACGRGNDATNDSLASVPGAMSGDSAAAATATPNADFAQMSDANIASTVGVINGGEIQAAELAETNASSADVKRFARDMITEHRAMQKAVDSLAAAKNVTPQSVALADDIRNEMQATMTRLGAMSGASFDSAYIDGQVMDHQKALDVLNGMAGTADDPDMRALIQSAIPKVQAHLDRARQLAARSGGTSTSGSGDTSARTDTTRR